MTPAGRLLGIRRLALAAVGTTLLLMALGAWVKANGAGLSCPDWPQCYGEWLPPFPSADNGGTWDFDGDGVDEPVPYTEAQVLYEWTHRFVVSLLLVPLIALAGLALASKDLHATPRRLLVTALLLYVSQAGLGAVTVVTGNPPWATTAHLVLATVLLTVLLVAATWLHLKPLAPALLPSETPAPAKARTLAYVYADDAGSSAEREA